MYHSKHSLWTAPVLGAILIVGGSVAPASAAQDPGVPSQPHASASNLNCLLTRIGDQYLRCDNFTGAGVPAPAWIPEQ